MLREPGLRVGIGSHTQRYANKIAKWIKRMVLAAGGELGSDQRADEWSLTNGSTLIARGVGGSIAGESIDLFMMDDVFGSREDADSVTVQEKVYEWYMDDVTPRLQEHAALVMVNTRWGPGDLIGRIQQSEEWPEWVYLRIPAIAETQEERDRNNQSQGLPAGQPDFINRAPGEPLCPDRFSLDKLLQKQRIEGVGFQPVYQQNPIPRGGTFFERRWLLGADSRPVYKSLDELPWLSPMPQGIRLVRYWDLAQSRHDSACYTAGVLLAKFNDGEHTRFYVVDVTRGRWMPAERNEKMREVAERDSKLRGFEKTWFESPVFDKNHAAARAIIAALAGYPVSGDNVSNQGSKELRAEGVAGAAKGGILKVLDGSWVNAFLQECESFPRSTYKDQCLPAGVPVWCRRGQIPVEQVTTDDEVMTRKGWRRVLASGMTAVSADTVCIGFSSGVFLECTHSHPVFVSGRGFVAAADIRLGDEVLTCLSKSMLSCGMELTGGGIRMPSSGTAGGTIRDTTTANSHRCTALNGSMPTGRSLMGTRFTTKTATHSITNWTTSNHLLLPSIAGARAISAPSVPMQYTPISNEFDHWLLRGIPLRRGRSGTVRTPRSLSPSASYTTSCASSVAATSNPNSAMRCFVAMPAARKLDRTDQRFTHLPVRGVSRNSQATDPSRSFALTVAVEKLDGQHGVPVYNLQVEGEPEFFAAGVLVHNCDSLSGAYNRLSRGGFAMSVA